VRAAGQDSPEWALKGAAYFDHETHRFTSADIEIDGELVSAIRPCGASTLTRGVDARQCVCTPGLVGTSIDGQVLLDIEPDRLIERGMTTGALFFCSAGECIRASRRTHARLYAHLLLNEFSRARAAQCAAPARVSAPEIRFFERIAAQVARHGGHLLPAIDCSSVLSAHELLYAQAFANALGLKLSVVLSHSTQAARSFRERFYCTEMQLLAFLQVLLPDAAVWGLSQLTRRDLRILRESGARAIGLPEAKAEERVDAATIVPAAALGDPTCGRIAPGMRADLCLFSTADRLLPGSGSESFLRLFQAGSPDAVIIAGKFVGGDLCRSREMYDKNARLSLVEKRQPDNRESMQTELPQRAFF
jgi:cytosine/adenosine deaminase-related metal-dependent hydrolase